MSTQRYRLIYEPAPGHVEVEWDKTAEELLRPNGEGTLLDFMLREADALGLSIRLESYKEWP